jgi:hypothetical protein
MPTRVLARLLRAGVMRTGEPRRDVDSTMGKITAGDLPCFPQNVPGVTESGDLLDRLCIMIFYSPVVTICTASGHYMYRQWSIYVPPAVTICTASGHYMYRQLNIQQLCVLPTQCIYVFWVDLRTNSDYFPIQH